ncbi:MAG: hypothetical protein ACREXR_20315, partial [Gammaproteobacteria bacterium]
CEELQALRAERDFCASRCAVALSSGNIEAARILAEKHQATSESIEVMVMAWEQSLLRNDNHSVHIVHQIDNG